MQEASELLEVAGVGFEPSEVEEEGHEALPIEVVIGEDVVASEVIDLDNILSPYFTCNIEDSGSPVVHIVFVLSAIDSSLRVDLPSVDFPSPPDALEIAARELEDTTSVSAMLGLA